MLHVCGEMASEHFVLARRNAIFVPRLRQNGLRAFWLVTLKLRFCPTSTAKRLFSILADGNLKLGLGAARAPLGRRRVSPETRFLLHICGEMASEHFGLEKGGAAEMAHFAPGLRGNGLRRLCQRGLPDAPGRRFCPTSTAKWTFFCKLGRLLAAYWPQ